MKLKTLKSKAIEANACGPSLGSYSLFELLKAISGTRQDPDPSVTGSDPGADTDTWEGWQGKHRQLDLRTGVCFK